MSFGGFGGDGGNQRPMMSEINVTPLVDVMLVLLIIFMVAAPMMTQGMNVDLPKVGNEALPMEENQTILTIRPLTDGTFEYSLDGTVLSREGDLGLQIKAAMANKTNASTLFLKADKSVPYGEVASSMAKMKDAGITSVGLVTEPPERDTPEDNKKSGSK